MHGAMIGARVLYEGCADIAGSRKAPIGARATPSGARHDSLRRVDDRHHPGLHAGKRS